MAEETRRELALEVAWRSWGKPYLWGGDDPSGWDCSGLVQEILKSVGAWSRGDDRTADGMLRYFEEKDCICGGEEAGPGDVVFFCTQEGKAIHVETVVERDDEGNLYSLGASGGGSATTDEESAWRTNAYVKIRPVSSVHPRLLKVFVDPYFVEVGLFARNGKED